MRAHTKILSALRTDTPASVRVKAESAEDYSIAPSKLGEGG